MKSLGQDPCTQGPALRSLLVSYCRMCIDGKNIKHKDTIRSGTISGYMHEVNALFRKRGLDQLIDFKDYQDPVNILIKNLSAEEDVADQRSPFTPQMVAEFFRRGKSADRNSLEALVLNIIVAGRGMGFRASETSTSTRTKPDYFTYPRSSKQVIKAMCENWWTGLDRNENVVDDIVDNKDEVVKTKINWKIQKNRRNNEAVTYVCDKVNTDCCIPTAIIEMTERARSLGQPADLPLCVYADANGNKKYLTSADLTKYIRDVAIAVHPNMSKKEIMRFSCHSIRVWACVLLYESGKKGDYIKKRLRWLSECYRIYLRDTEKTASQHNECLREYSDLISAMKLTQINLPENVEYTVEEDEEMGVYDDLDG